MSVKPGRACCWNDTRPNQFVIIFDTKRISCTVITKEQIKREVDNLPESLLEEVYALLKKFVINKAHTGKRKDLKRLEDSLSKFTSDFMVERNQPNKQERESFD